MSASESDDDAAAAEGSLLLPNLLLAGGSDSSDNEDDEDKNSTDPAAGAEASTAGSEAHAPTAPTEPRSCLHGSSTAAGMLPTALDALDDCSAAFLHVEALEPEFDASAHFRPPAVSANELLRASHASDRQPRLNADGPPPQRSSTDEPTRGPANGNGIARLRGSVCTETDDERGRRVVYGAHQMLKADPWSDCNPNFPMRRHAAGRKRRQGTD